MKKFKKLLVCMLAVMMLISSAIPVSAATRPAIPTLRSAQMTSSGRMSLSWKSVSNANGYKVRIYNCRKKKASSIHLKVQQQLLYKQKCEHSLSCIRIQLQMGKWTANLQYRFGCICMHPKNINYCIKHSINIDS